MTEPTDRTASRRQVLKGGVVATGAAFVAPQILHTSIAGASTTICYGVKFEPGPTGLRGQFPHDPSCNTAFNNAIAAAFSGSPVIAPPPGFVTVGGIGSQSGTITVTEPGCSLAFVGYKAGQDCFFGNGSGGIVMGSTSATIAAPANAISHITVVICCESSAPA